MRKLTVRTLGIILFSVINENFLDNSGWEAGMSKKIKKLFKLKELKN
jgi:hypothetical protein